MRRCWHAAMFAHHFSPPATSTRVRGRCHPLAGRCNRVPVCPARTARTRARADRQCVGSAAAPRTEPAGGGNREWLTREFSQVDNLFGRAVASWIAATPRPSSRRGQTRPTSVSPTVVISSSMPTRSCARLQHQPAHPEVGVAARGVHIDQARRRDRDLQFAQLGRAPVAALRATQVGHRGGVCSQPYQPFPLRTAAKRPATRRRSRSAGAVAEPGGAAGSRRRTRRTGRERRHRLVPQHPHRGQILVGARARSAMDTPSALSSGSTQPTPTPTVSRPPDRKSIDDSCLASNTGWRWGNTISPKPSRTRVVSAARWASATTASSRSCVAGSVWRQGDVIADPQRLEPGVLGRPRPPGQHLRRRVLPLVQPIEPELHARERTVRQGIAIVAPSRERGGLSGREPARTTAATPA